MYRNIHTSEYSRRRCSEGASFIDEARQPESKRSEWCEEKQIMSLTNWGSGGRPAIGPVYLTQ
jgi:hypothetical protein